MSTHDEIRAALDAATPGPWHAWDRGIGFEVHAGPDCDDVDYSDQACRELNGEFRETFRGDDAHLIANAPTWLAELLAENERLNDLASERRSVVVRLDQAARDWEANAGDAEARAESAEQAIARVRGIAERARARGGSVAATFTDPQWESGRLSLAELILRALDGGE